MAHQQTTQESIYDRRIISSPDNLRDPFLWSFLTRPSSRSLSLFAAPSDHPDHCLSRFYQRRLHNIWPALNSNHLLYSPFISYILFLMQKLAQLVTLRIYCKINIWNRWRSPLYALPYFQVPLNIKLSLTYHCFHRSLYSYMCFQWAFNEASVNHFYSNIASLQTENGLARREW